MEAASGGEVFNIEADRVVLSAGAIKSPHLLMVSGIGPKDQLQAFGIPMVHDLPSVGQSLWNHLSAQMTFKVKDGISLSGDEDSVRFSLHYTSQGSSVANDMLLRTSPMVDQRPERCPSGTRAGGQPDGQRSAALLVYENEGFGIMNLRVDDDTDSMAALWRVFNKMQPLVPYYQERPDNPEIGRVYNRAKARGIGF